MANLQDRANRLKLKKKECLTIVDLMIRLILSRLSIPNYDI